LSGLVCGLRLAKAGKRCVIISAGQSALHFSSGSFDLLGALPSGESVGSPAERVAQLIEQEPSHPYAKIGAEAVVETAEAAKQTLVDAGVRVSGDAAQNHYRLTPMGTLKATWLTLDGYVRSATEEGLEWKNVVVMNAEGFLDFYTQFIVDELRKKGTTGRVMIRRSRFARLSALEPGWKNCAPGTVLKLDRTGPVVKCLDTALILTELKPEGGKIMDGGAFLRGRQMRPLEDRFV
jgi:anaerobic glycerol-3-phosphate dehydrogenase B subunit